MSEWKETGVFRVSCGIVGELKYEEHFFAKDHDAWVLRLFADGAEEVGDAPLAAHVSYEPLREAADKIFAALDELKANGENDPDWKP